jgi:hypothetical protein
MMIYTLPLLIGAAQAQDAEILTTCPSDAVVVETNGTVWMTVAGLMKQEGSIGQDYDVNSWTPEMQAMHQTVSAPLRKDGEIYQYTLACQQTETGRSAVKGSDTWRVDWAKDTSKNWVPTPVQYGAGETNKDGIMLDNVDVIYVPKRMVEELADINPRLGTPQVDPCEDMYITKDELTVILGDYYTKTEIDEILSQYARLSDLSGFINESSGDSRYVLRSEIPCLDDLCEDPEPTSSVEIFPRTINPWNLSRLGAIGLASYDQNSWKNTLTYEDGSKSITDLTQRTPGLQLQASLPLVAIHAGDSGQLRLFGMYDGQIGFVTGGFNGKFIDASNTSYEFDGNFDGSKMTHILYGGIEGVSNDARFALGLAVGPVLAQSGTRHTKQEGITQDSEFEGNGLSLMVQGQAPFILGRWTMNSTNITDITDSNIENLGTETFVVNTSAKAHEFVLGSPLETGNWDFFPHLNGVLESYDVSGDVANQETDLTGLLVGADAVWNPNASSFELRFGVDYGVQLTQETDQAESSIIDDNRTLNVSAGVGVRF